MPEFWETAFSTNRTMWGETPADNARTVLDLFQEHGIKTMLVPGFGYGRNAKVFYDQGIKVTGIEISETAIARARKHFGSDVVIHYGSVTDMPFDNALYDGIYCYSLIHLLNKTDRRKLIDDCHQQLKPGGLMVFVALSVNDKRYGTGEEIAPNTFLSPHGLQLYFYNEAAIDEEFGNYTTRQNSFLYPLRLSLSGLKSLIIRKGVSASRTPNMKMSSSMFGNYGILEAKEINEPKEAPKERFWMVVCRKRAAD